MIEIFLQKWLKESLIIDVGLGSNYTSAYSISREKTLTLNI